MGVKDWWLGVWGGFAGKHPTAAKWLYQIFFFIVFCEGVTLFQYVIYAFMPGWLGTGLAGVAWSWPAIPVKLFGVEFTWNALGYDVIYDASGAVAVGGGLGYLISMLTGSFLAQCINFPLQRNITFKSHGKIPYQIMWYFIAWVIITPVVNSINCIWVSVAKELVAPWLYSIGSTVLMGTISMVVFFFVFKIIFPEGEAKKGAGKTEASG